MLSVIAWRNIGRNRRRSILCITAVGIAVFFIIFMNSWMDGMFIGIENTVRTYETGHVLAVSEGFEAEKEYLPVQFPLEKVFGGTEDYSDENSARENPSRGTEDYFSDDELIRLAESLPEVRGALPRIQIHASLFDNVVKHALVWGIDIDREREINHFNLTKRTDGLVYGRFPANDANECVIGTALAEKAGLRIGDRIPLKTVSAEFSDKYWSPEITGIFEFDYRKMDEDTIIVPIDRLQRILGLGDRAQQLVVFAHDQRDSERIKADMEQLLGDRTVIRTWTDNYWVAMYRSMTWLYYIIFGVFQVVASFLIVNTVLMMIHERIKEIGMMGALGMKRAEIVFIFFMEAVYLSILGATAGVFLGGVATWVGSQFPFDMTTITGGGMKDLPVSGTLYLVFSPTMLIQNFFFGVVISALCTIIPSLKSAFVEPVEALRR